MSVWTKLVGGVLGVSLAVAMLAPVEAASRSSSRSNSMTRGSGQQGGQQQAAVNRARNEAKALQMQQYQRWAAKRHQEAIQKGNLPSTGSTNTASSSAK